MKFNPRSLYMYISQLETELESTRVHITNTQNTLSDLNNTSKQTQKKILELIEDINSGKWG